MADENALKLTESIKESQLTELNIELNSRHNRLNQL